MDAKNGLVNFGLFILLFVFTFVFCLDALAIPNTFYGVLALIGYLVCVTASLFTGYISRRDGDALAVWYNTYAVVVSIVFIWYLTRCGTSFGWW
ncbi:MAG: hypothetical protein JNG85_11795 [Spirochaetaceae bacterium]|nr:hypothetical protein [Spirochaetaceae bacterium]